MSKGRAYRRWRSLLKYISRLKKNMYYWKVTDDSEPTKKGYSYMKKWRNPESWKELDEKGGHAKLLKKTASFVKKTKWEKIDDRNRIKDLREESKRIIDNELNNNE
jgi:hypothetical protein